MSNQTTSNSPESTENHPSNNRTGFLVHIVFLIVLLSVLVLKYYLYFASPHTGDGITGARIGATIGHLLMWAFAYYMCLKSSNRIRMGLLAAPTLFLGILTVPLLGYLGIIIMYIIFRKERKSTHVSIDRGAA